MPILGIHGGHDASAALVADGKLLASFREEQLRNIKHYSGYPIKAIETLMNEFAVTPEMLEAIAFSTSSPIYGARRDHLYITCSDKYIEMAQRIDPIDPFPSRSMLQAVYQDHFDNTHLSDHNLAHFLHLAAAKTPIYFLDHHICHAACVYFAQSAIDTVVTADGRGDSASGMIFDFGNTRRLRPIAKRSSRKSIGALYQCATEVAGFLGIDSEYKLMGAAALGTPSHAWTERAVRELLSPDHYWEWAPYWQLYPQRSRQNPLNGIVPKPWLLEMYASLSFLNFAATIQCVFEYLLTQWISPYLVPRKRLFLVGGCFLNAKFNQRLKAENPDVSFVFWPDAGDSGLSAGAAAFVYSTLFGGTHDISFDVFSGLLPGTGEIFSSTAHRVLKRSAIDINEVCDRITVGETVGLCIGRSELGPRALGHRSMLANAQIANIRDVINRKKGREDFVPVSPSMTESFARQFLHSEATFGLRYMNETVSCKTSLREIAPAIVHADGTVRPQVVPHDDSSALSRILQEMEKRTGFGVIVNTSLNMSGLPTCGTKEAALDCLKAGAIDTLITDTELIYI